MKMKGSNTFFSMFGELGEMIQFAIAMFVFLGVFMAGPMLLMKMMTWLNPSSPPTKVATSATVSSQNSLTDQLVEYDSLGRTIALRLDSELVASRQKIESKKEVLSQLLAQTDSLDLTPSQRALMSSFPRKSADDVPFSSWVSSRPVIYNIIVGFLNSLVFYVFGRRKRRKLDKAAAANSGNNDVHT